MPRILSRTVDIALVCFAAAIGAFGPINADERAAETARFRAIGGN